MTELEFTRISSMIAANPAPLALVAAITAASAAYAYCIISARRTSSQFSLGRLEEFELERSVLLYERVIDRLADIRDEEQQIEAGLLARYKHRKQVRQNFAAELQDLRSYLAHLRSMILRLRSAPAQRFKSWLHRDSACFALSRSLTLCFLVIAMLTGCVYVTEQPDVIGEYIVGGEAIAAVLGAWQPLQGRMLDTGSIGSMCCVATPVFYFYRRTRLQVTNRRQFRNLKKFAGTDPDALFHHAPPIAATMPEEPLSAVPDIPCDTTWFSILGISHSATIEEVKQAYKMKIKQNHPDRVREMSPLFRDLAEAETKKLNAAYEEAMASLQSV